MLIQVYSAIYNVDPKLVQSIIKIESNYDPTAISSKGAVGLMQIIPKYVHKTRKQLLDPETNVSEGIKYLIKIKQECIHKDDLTFVVCYAMGAPKGNKVKHPKKFWYYKRFIKEYRDAKDKALSTCE